MPAEHQNRTVIIAPRVLKTLQSGTAGKEQWQIYWPNSIRWTNPLMGWTSTSDPMSNVVVSVRSLLIDLTTNALCILVKLYF